MKLNTTIRYSSRQIKYHSINLIFGKAALKTGNKKFVDHPFINENQLFFIQFRAIFLIFIQFYIF